jgi:hypothetical protein
MSPDAPVAFAIGLVAHELRPCECARVLDGVWRGADPSSDGIDQGAVEAPEMQPARRVHVVFGEEHVPLSEAAIHALAVDAQLLATADRNQLASTNAQPAAS